MRREADVGLRKAPSECRRGAVHSRGGCCGLIRQVVALFRSSTDPSLLPPPARVAAVTQMDSPHPPPSHLLPRCYLSNRRVRPVTISATMTTTSTRTVLRATRQKVRLPFTMAARSFSFAAATSLSGASSAASASSNALAAAVDAVNGECASLSPPKLVLLLNRQPPSSGSDQVLSAASMGRWCVLYYQCHRVLEDCLHGIVNIAIPWYQLGTRVPCKPSESLHGTRVPGTMWYGRNGKWYTGSTCCLFDVRVPDARARGLGGGLGEQHRWEYVGADAVAPARRAVNLCVPRVHVYYLLFTMVSPLHVMSRFRVPGTRVQI